MKKVKSTSQPRGGIDLSFHVSKLASADITGDCAALGEQLPVDGALDTPPHAEHILLLVYFVFGNGFRLFFFVDSLGTSHRMMVNNPLLISGDEIIQAGSRSFVSEKTHRCIYPQFFILVTENMGNPATQLSHHSNCLQSSNDSCVVHSKCLLHFPRSRIRFSLDCVLKQIQIHQSSGLRPLLVFEIVVPGIEAFEPIANCWFRGDILGIYSSQLTMGVGWFGSRKVEEEHDVSDMHIAGVEMMGDCKR